ncbi:MAG: DNA polymerase III subunit psi [Gammaproteobacteria bacterium]
MTPAVRAQYLKQMGIVAYVPVGPKHLSPSSDEAPIKLVFLLQSSTLDWSSPEHQLLKKIMVAVGLPEEEMAICYSETLPLRLPEVSPSAKVVAFGRGLTVSLPKGSVETMPLNELQHNDSAKRQLWQELKAIKAAYGH